MTEIEELAKKIREISPFLIGDFLGNAIAKMVIESGYHKQPTGTVKVRDLVEMPEKMELEEQIKYRDYLDCSNSRKKAENSLIDLIGNLEVRALRPLDKNSIKLLIYDRTSYTEECSEEIATKICEDFGQPAQSLPSKEIAFAIRKLIEEKAR